MEDSGGLAAEVVYLKLRIDRLERERGLLEARVNLLQAQIATQRARLQNAVENNQAHVHAIQTAETELRGLLVVLAAVQRDMLPSDPRRESVEDAAATVQGVIALLVS